MTDQAEVRDPAALEAACVAYVAPIPWHFYDDDEKDRTREDLRIAITVYLRVAALHAGGVSSGWEGQP